MRWTAAHHPDQTGTRRRYRLTEKVRLRTRDARRRNIRYAARSNQLKRYRGAIESATIKELIIHSNGENPRPSIQQLAQRIQRCTGQSLSPSYISRVRRSEKAQDALIIQVSRAISEEELKESHRLTMLDALAHPDRYQRRTLTELADKWDCASLGDYPDTDGSR